jgi:hypothetical protein
MVVFLFLLALALCAIGLVPLGAVVAVVGFIMMQGDENIDAARRDRERMGGK